MRNSLDNGYPSFKDTSVEMLSSGLQKQLATACENYIKFSKLLKDKEKQKELDGTLDREVNDQLTQFINTLNDAIGSALDNQSKLENKRIHSTVELLIKQYLDYLRNGIEEIAPEWNLSISDSLLDTLNTPELNPINLKAKVADKTRLEGIGWTLWIFNRTIKYKTLPDSKTLHDDSALEIMNQLAFFVPQFQQMIHQYIIELTDNISKKQDRVSQDFGNKLTQAHFQQHDDYEKSVRRWQPLHEKSQQLSELLKQLVKWESI